VNPIHFSKPSPRRNATPPSERIAFPVEALLSPFRSPATAAPYRLPGWKRALDLAIGGLLALLCSPLLFLCWAAVKLTSAGPALHWSERVGKDNRRFAMPKFRTMRLDTPQMATHLLLQPERYLTPIGAWLRKTSLDELPQLLSVWRGDLSLVGPRPALFNQDDLIALRTRHGVHRLVPGITGWAQVNGRDELEIPIKVRFDAEYMAGQSPLMDINILALTLWRVLKAEGIQH
jgi:O-antigen biosynthesis protein WbqP